MTEHATMKSISNHSFFLRFHEDSPVAKKLFEENPSYRNKEAIVVQLMMIKDGYILAEIVYKDN